MAVTWRVQTYGGQVIEIPPPPCEVDDCPNKPVCAATGSACGEFVRYASGQRYRRGRHTPDRDSTEALWKPKVGGHRPSEAKKRDVVSMVPEIRQQYIDGAQTSEIMEWTGLSDTTIRDIVRGRTHKNIAPELITKSQHQGARRMTDAQKLHIADRLKRGEKKYSIAKQLGINRRTVERIARKVRDYEL